jgi:transcriptional regulator with XRE-family HTH domain
MRRLVFEIGATLREARMRRRLDISECEQATRIRARYLQALEEGHLDLIPAPVYVRSFLRTYAEFLGVDPERLLDEYAAGYDTAPEAADSHEVRQISAPRFRPRMPGGQLTWLAIGGVLAVALLVWVGAGDGGPTAVPLPPTETAGPTSPPPSAPVPPAAVPAAPAVPRGVVLSLTGGGDAGSYVEVRRRSAEGETVWVGTLAPGVSRRFSDDRALWLRAGWTPSLTARLNGRRVTLEGGTAEFAITPRGVQRTADG